MAAVESGNHGNVGKLIIRGASNIDQALEESRRLRKHVITAALLIIKAAMENDRILVLKLYGENVQGVDTKIELTEEDDLAKLQHIVCGCTVKTVVPIEIARRCNASAVREELLLRTDIDKDGGTVLWHGLHLIALEISWLRKIHWVKKLSLAQNKFVLLPPEMGSYLKQCTELNLQRNKLHEIPCCLLELPRIRVLNLSNNDIAEIPDVPEWSPTLSVLDLSHNHLKTIPNSAVAPYLKNMNISGNKFHTVPHCVCSFIGLTTLNIAYNTDILSLPSELGRLKNLLNLNLDGLNLIYPPKNVRITTADCIRYLNSRLRSACGFYHMKLMVLGKCNSGKSTVVDQLCDKQSIGESTTGIDVTEWKYAPSHDRKTFHFSIWDFASQEAYYATYQCFLSKRSLYLLVWDITEGDKGVGDLKPWLNHISVRAADSLIIIVGTFLDKVSEDDRQSGKIDELLRKVFELTAQYRRLNVTNITVVGLQDRQTENVQKLRDYIYNAASEYRIKDQFVMGAKIPSSYHKMFTKLHTIHNQVKCGEHEPIMHAAEFRKMVTDLNLTDIQDDEELITATRFLHEVGALLHYDDRKHNLDDLYFVDPRWLCNLMSAIVTANEKNLCVNGILKRSTFSLLFKDMLPSKYHQQYLTLLSRFEIALPLDENSKSILIPSLLSKSHPAIVHEYLQDGKRYYERLIVFCSSTLYKCHTPPGLWSRLLSRIMNKVKEVKRVLYEQVPCDDSAMDDGSLIYWSTGLLCNVNNLVFIVESLEETGKHQDRNGVFIMCSLTAAGCRVLGNLIDIVEQLISDWYPGLRGEVEYKVPCYECATFGAYDPYEFKVDQLLPLIAEHKMCINCSGCNNILQLMFLVPDLLMADLDTAFLLDSSEVIYKKDKESFLGNGAFGEVYHGKYKDQSVAVKLYTTKEGNRVGEGLKELRSESKVLQQLHHPCLVCMVGVTLHPTMSLVLEEAPLGTLQTPLLKEQKPISRIVMYRIAIQVASALHFLHSIYIIFRDLKADNVLLWSLSPDHLINCKVTDFSIATHADPGGARGLHGTKGFIAPEVAYVNHLKERSVYDHRADIFSFGMFLYQLIARRHPFHNVVPFKIEAAIEEGQRPQLEDIPVAEIGLFYMTRVMKKCWAGSANERPKTQEIVEWLCAPALQLIISIIPVSSKYSVRNGCIVSPYLSNEIRPVTISSELWICCDGLEGIELNIFRTNTMAKMGKHFVRENQVHCMKQCDDHIWVASRAGLDSGVVDIFSSETKDLVHVIKMRENAVSCITNSDRLVYMGTMEGYCFAFPMNVQTIQCGDIEPKYKYVSEHCIDGVVLTKTCLWASTHNQIHFLHPDSLNLVGVERRRKNAQAFVGLMQLSDNEDQVWSAHLGGVIMSSWNAHQRVHLCDIDVGVIAEEKCHVGDPQYHTITAMCTGLDTVWIGLASGHIIVFGMNPSGEVLTYFRPYHSYVRFLSSANYPGPCGKEECMMLSGGKVYQPDDSFKELPDFCCLDENGLHDDTAGVAILWEVLPAKYIQQVHYLREGTSYLSYSRLEETMIVTNSMYSIPLFSQQSNDQLRGQNKPKQFSQLLTECCPEYHIANDECHFKERNEWSTTEGVYEGIYKSKVVTIKLCNELDKNSIREHLKKHFSEGLLLQQYHPCVAHLIGVSVSPATSFVLDEISIGTLKTVSYKAIPRIVLYRLTIQITSAMSFLFDRNITHFNLDLDNILVLSFSPDCMINCKVIAFNLSSHTDHRWVPNLQSFSTSTVVHHNHCKNFYYTFS